jgi:hypothetical protein
MVTGSRYLAPLNSPVHLTGNTTSPKGMHLYSEHYIDFLCPTV